MHKMTCTNLWFLLFLEFEEDIEEALILLQCFMPLDNLMLILVSIMPDGGKRILFVNIIFFHLKFIIKLIFWDWSNAMPTKL